MRLRGRLRTALRVMRLSFFAVDVAHLALYGFGIFILFALSDIVAVR